MLGTTIIYYFAIAFIVFCFWLVLFLLDNTTPKTDSISWVILLIAPLLWPIVLPISCMELVKKIQKRQQLLTRKISESNLSEGALSTKNKSFSGNNLDVSETNI
jgi:hypothetical protein